MGEIIIIKDIRGMVTGIILLIIANIMDTAMDTIRLITKENIITAMPNILKAIHTDMGIADTIKGIMDTVIIIE